MQLEVIRSDERANLESRARSIQPIVEEGEQRLLTRRQKQEIMGMIMQFVISVSDNYEVLLDEINKVSQNAHLFFSVINGVYSVTDEKHEYTIAIGHEYVSRDF